MFIIIIIDNTLHYFYTALSPPPSPSSIHHNNRENVCIVFFWCQCEKCWGWFRECHTAGKKVTRYMMEMKTRGTFAGAGRSKPAASVQIIFVVDQRRAVDAETRDDSSCCVCLMANCGKSTRLTLLRIVHLV